MHLPVTHFLSHPQLRAEISWAKLQQLTCCVWGCGCTEKRELWGAGTEACQVNRTPSGRPPAGCASCLRFPLRTLQTSQEGTKKQNTLSSCRECNSGVIVVIQNTILTSPLQNKQCPLTWCMLLQYTASSHGVTRSFMMQTCTPAVVFACFLLPGILINYQCLFVIIPLIHFWIVNQNV